MICYYIAAPDLHTLIIIDNSPCFLEEDETTRYHKMARGALISDEGTYDDAVTR